MKKALPVILTAVAMVAASVLLGFLFNFLLPSVQVEYENTAMYRPWDDPLMYLYFIQPFIFAASLIWIWDRVSDRFLGNNWRKAWNFTLIGLFVSIIPGMIMTISTFQVSAIIILTWTISAFVQLWVGSVVFIRMKKP